MTYETFSKIWDESTLVPITKFAMAEQTKDALIKYAHGDKSGFDAVRKFLSADVLANKKLS